MNLKLCLVLLVIKKSFAEILTKFQSETNLERNFSEAINDAILSSFIEKDSTVTVVKSESPAVTLLVSSILAKQYAQFKVKVVALGTKEKFQSKNLLVVIVLKSASELSKLNVTLNAENFDSNGFYLIVILNSSLTEPRKIFEIFWKKNAHNVNVILHVDNNLAAITFMPFAGLKCADLTPITINSFNKIKKKWDQPFYFPRKFRNLKGCKIVHEITLAASVKGANGDFSGIEVNIMNVFAENLNFTAEHKVSKSKGQIFNNGTATDILGRLQDKKIDATSASLQLKRAKLFSPTYPFVSDPLVLVIPKGKLLSSFEKLHKAFRIEVWIGILVIFIVGVVMVKLTSTLFIPERKSSKMFLNLFNSFLGGSLEKIDMPDQHITRYSLTVFMLYALVLRTAYTGKLFVFLSTELRHPEMKDVDEMMENGFTLYAYESMWDRILDYAFINRFCKTTFLIINDFTICKFLGQSSPLTNKTKVLKRWIQILEERSLLIRDKWKRGTNKQ